MPLLLANSRCRRLALFLALTAGALQVMSFSLPSQVVCYQAGRPPRVEFFAASCSCRQEACRSNCEHGQAGAPCLEAACIDLHLSSFAMPVGAVRPCHFHAGSARPVTAIDRHASRLALLNLRLASAGRCLTWAEAPPPRSAPIASSRLRC